MTATAPASSGFAYPPLAYRPEIDGLRAVAVLVVVLFHAKLGFSGGYVGVDVFFVISGFLITSLILRDIHTTKFDALDFWERRVRRIAPALIATLIATMIAGWFLYLPKDFERLGRAVVAQTVVWSNMHHCGISDYFGPNSETLPLLHTWSLAVEEQYYILLPIVLVMIGSRRRAWLPPLIAAACAISFAWGWWATPRFPTEAYFWLPTRAWELLIGSLLAAYPLIGNTSPRWIRETLSLGGLVAIGLSVALFNESSSFPGYLALVPCLGAAAFLWANRDGLTRSGRWLTWKPLVFTGQVSYSFYLLHWPVLVFSFYWFLEELSWDRRFGLVVATFLLAVLSWLAIETPVRKKWILADRRVLFSAATGCLLLLFAGGQAVRLNHGFASRFRPGALRYTTVGADSKFLRELSLEAAESGTLTPLGASDGPIGCLVWGDSHAMALMPAVDRLCRENGLKGFGATRSSTAPLLGFVSQGKHSLKGDSPRFSAAIAEFAERHRVPVVVLVGFWSTYADDPAFSACLAQTVESLTAAGSRVVIVRDVPVHAGDVPWLLDKASLVGRDVRTVGVSLARHREKNRAADEAFLRVAAPDVVVLDPTSLLLDETGLCRAELDGEAMYRDGDHLSVAGALRLTPLLEPVLPPPQLADVPDERAIR